MVEFHRTFLKAGSVSDGETLRSMYVTFTTAGELLLVSHVIISDVS
jgi:hypothetical protein